MGLFLALKGLSARDVYNEFPAVHGADALAYFTVARYLHHRQFSSVFVDRPEEVATIVINQAILDTFEQYPFSSIRELARFACIPTITVH
jgi:hypothetical protein